MVISRKKGGALLLAAGSVAGLLFGPLDLASAHGNDKQPQVSNRLIEASWCSSPDGRQGSHNPKKSPGAGAPVTGGVQQTITVAIAPTAFITVDKQGRVTSAWTNTGCAPDSGDDTYIEQPNGRIVPASGRDFTNQRWVGDFRAAGVKAIQRR